VLLCITTTHRPATDLGYLLHKHPERCQSFDLTFGAAHVFYPEATAERCTAALLLDVDPIGLVRRRQGPAGEGFSLQQYVNDRPYVASSFMSVAIARVFGSALAGRCDHHEELAAASLPLSVRLSVLPCRGGEALLRRLFEPLGYAVTAKHEPLDDQFPEWGKSRYFNVELQAESRLQDVLSHVYVLIPVLDDDKHYWVGEDEVKKLLRIGEPWLPAHPERELIVRRYLKHQGRLANEALLRLVAEESPVDERQEHAEAEEEAVEVPLRLNEQRIEAVVAALQTYGAKTVVDLGCGEGKLLRRVLREKTIQRIVGMDVSFRALEIAKARLDLDRMAPKQRERIELIHGSLMYRDERLTGFDGATVVEVIEHLDPPRLAAFERVVFECAKPRIVIVTTPNVEYNVRFEDLPAGRFRHKDHRFEWTRAEFQQWAASIGDRFSYAAEFGAIGDEDLELGAATQMAVFSRLESAIP